MRPLALTLAAVGLAVVARALPRARARRFQLQRDIPALGLRRGQFFRLEPDAPIYLDDLVVLRPDDFVPEGAPEGAPPPGERLSLARYRDELIHRVVGRLCPC